MEKKGSARGWIIGLSVAVGVLLFLVFMAYNPKLQAFPVWLDTKQPNINWNSPLGWFLTYIFGIDENKAPTISAFVTFIAVWLIFFLAFGDGIEKFGFFSKWVSWMIGLAIAIILANAGFFYNLIINFMAIFSFLAGLSVIAALASVFFAMFLVHWGISQAGLWLMKRKAMMEGAKAAAGGAELRGKIEGLMEAGEALKGS